MSRKVEVEVIVKLQLIIDDDVEVSEIMDELDYNFLDTTTQATIVDTSIEDYNIKDSR